MNTLSFEEAEDFPPSIEVSDVALERAACSENNGSSNFTLGACTGLSECPG